VTRISTHGMHQNALTAMLRQQATLSQTQNQIATGKRVQTPADDPVAAVHIMELERALSENEQFGANANIAANRLTLEEQALSDAGALLQRVRELAIQANSGSVDASGRRMISTEVRARLGELVDLANRRDANGEYLFSGYSTLTQPFNTSGSNVAYAGDQGSRLLQIGPSQRVADSDSGFDVFMDVPQGNGTFVVDGAAGNTGDGVITPGSVTNRAAWVPDDYTLRFTTATNWEVVNSAAAVVATGTYTNPATISFNGVSVGLSGTPATGDSFSIARSRSEDLFATINSLVTALESPAGSGSSGAQFQIEIGRTLQQLDISDDHLLNIRAKVGTRLSALDSAESSRDELKVELQRMTSELRDLDYAEAITRMNQQLVGLQAAQATYTQISQLSLFDYLR
jgi:flagellar hook-associated protein 3 FlgL